MKVASEKPVRPVTWGALLYLLWDAYMVRRGKRELVTLPAVARVGLAKRHRLGCFRQALCRLDWLTFWLIKPCFYRSYTACAIGRRLGLPTTLNLGLRVCGETRHRAHAWISLKGVIIGEQGNPRLEFANRIGGAPEVCYWLAVMRPPLGKSSVAKPLGTKRS